MLWFALLLPHPALSPFTRAQVDDHPLAVVDTHPRHQVAAATASACSRGIQPGMGVASALALIPDLILCPRDPHQEQAILEELATWGARFTPRISLSPPDGVLLEVSASLRLFGGADALCASLQAGCTALGLPCAVGAAPTPLAARWLARHHPGSVHEGATPWLNHLDALPLGCLQDGTGLDGKLPELLHGLGLETLGEVRRLPRDGLARREGSEALRILARARGECAHPQAEFTPPLHYRASMSLPVPTASTEPLLFAVSRLVQGLCDWLAARHTGSDRLQLHLEPERGAAETLTLVTGRPARSAERFQHLLREHLGRWQLKAPVARITLECHAPLPLAPRSDDLFGSPEQQREQAEALMERLQARLGMEAVWTAHCVADHRPEYAWQRQLPDAPVHTAPTTPRPRPLWLLPQPRRLGPNPAFRILQGPERIESGWWDGHDVRRDYYTALTPDGGLCWVFREREGTPDWYLHGYFA